MPGESFAIGEPIRWTRVNDLPLSSALSPRAEFLGLSSHKIMSAHITPLRIYFLIFGALLVSTGLTVFVAFQDLEPFNDLIAMAIAGLKGTLVVLWFMHVRHSSRLSKVVVIAGFFWLALLLALTLSDYLTRGYLS